jgi:hypothetical protein
MAPLGELLISSILMTMQYRLPRAHEKADSLAVDIERL